MAFPAVVGRNVTSINTAATSHDIDIGSPASGTLVVILARAAASATISWPGGWDVLVASDTTDASNDSTAIAYRLCDGTEGATITVTTSSSKLAALAYEITGAADPGTQSPEISTIVTGDSDVPDPSSLAPTGGAKDYLWLWLGAWEGEQTSPPTGNPANYTDPQGANTGVGGSATTNCRVAIAERELNASSEDPPSWTISVTDSWTAWTMAIHPAGASTQNLTGTLLTNTPTFFTGVVSTGAVALTGTLFQSTPTFNVGVLTVDQALTGTLFSSAPTFFAGAVRRTFDFVQEKTGGATDTTLTVTLDASPTVGNTLIARVASRDSTRLGHVAGFKPLDWNANGNGIASVWYRQVQSGDSAAVVLTNNASAVCTMHVEEVVGQLVPHRSANRFDSNTDVTTFGTGVTAATTELGLACAFVAHRNVTSTNYSWSDSYTLRATQTQGSGTTGVTGIPGDKIVTTGTQEGVLSWTTAARPWSCIGVLVEDAEPALDAYATEVLSHSPFSYYRLDDPGAVGAADLVGNVHLKYSGGYSQNQTGVITDNSAASFDGTNGMATEVPTAGWATYVGDCTVLLWVKTPDPNQAFGSAAFLSRQNDAHGTHAFMLDGSGDWNFHYRNNAVLGQNIPVGNALTDTWEFFAWTIGAAGVKVYGAVAGVVTELGSATDITQGAFDLHQLGKTQGAVWLEATLDEVAVWHSVLTSTDLQDIYNAAGVAIPIVGTLFTSAPTFFVGTVTPGAVALTGTLFTSVPTFFVGEVASEAGTQTLDGVLFQSTPTFSVGELIVEQFLTGTLFQNTPTFFAGAVTTGEVSVSGVLFVNTPTFNVGTVASSYDLDGTLFVNTPTFFQGEVAASYDLTGTLFTKAPAFFAGEVAPGEVALSGVLFQNTPVFEQGVLSQEGGPIFLTGTLFQKAPTFPQGTVTPGGVSLTGVLFQSTPTFNAGDVTSSRDLAGVLFQQAPMFFQGDVSLRGLAGELFVSAPAFFVGTITQPAEASTNWPVSTPAPWPGTDSIGWPVSKESEWQGV